jgi:hypothetical protein
MATFGSCGLLYKTEILYLCGGCDHLGYVVHGLLCNNSDDQDEVLLCRWGEFFATAFDTFLPIELQRPPANNGVVRGGRQLVYMLAAVPTKLHALVKALWIGGTARGS